MTAPSTAILLVNHGVTKSHSRSKEIQRQSHFNGQFKTMKYCLAFPKRVVPHRVV
jgi:ribosomal protein L32